MDSIKKFNKYLQMIEACEQKKITAQEAHNIFIYFLNQKNSLHSKILKIFAFLDKIVIISNREDFNHTLEWILIKNQPLLDEIYQEDYKIIKSLFKVCIYLLWDLYDKFYADIKREYKLTEAEQILIKQYGIEFKLYFKNVYNRKI